jgi:hypothetical protein
MFHPTLMTGKSKYLFLPLVKFCEWWGLHFPVSLIKLRYRYVFKKPIDLKNPKDLNEKILWAKLFSDTSKWTELADKYKVRDYVEGLGLGKYLVKLYAVWYDAKEVNFDVLPDTFIIKANNGDGKGTNKIIRKSELTDEKKAELVKMIDEWLHRKNIGALHAEPQYKGMKPCVIAEEVLPCDPGTTTLTDYKIWCFNGKAYYVWICNDRSAGGNSAHVMTYDLDWNAHPEFSVFNSDYLRGEIIPKPQNFEEMIQVAEKLSQGFPELRVDLYNVQGKIYFGELTFTSQGGFMDFYTPEFNLELGSKFDIKDFPVKKK